MLQLQMMEKLPIATPEPTRNPVTKAAFRRQVWLQIYLPFLGGFVLVAAVAWLLWNGGMAGASAWADASLILLLVPVLVLSVIPIVLLAALAYGVSYLLGQIPVPAHQVQQSLAQVQRIAEVASDRVSKPVIVFKSGAAAARATAKKIKSIYSRMG